MIVFQEAAVCPRCGQIDAVRKVSSIVSEGTSSTQQVGVAPNLMGTDLFLVGLQGSSATALAQRLAPRVPRPGGIGLRMFLAVTAILVGSVMACGLSLFAVTPEFGRFACGNWVLGIAIVAGVAALLPMLGIPGIRRKQAVYDTMMAHAQNRWGQLYYCARDDVTFNPEEGMTIAIADLRSYLYS